MSADDREWLFDWILSGVLLLLCIIAHSRISELETRIAALESAAEVEKAE